MTARPRLFSACRTLVLLAAALFAPVPAAAAQPVLRVLAWPGYAEPEVVKSFEQRHAVRVELTVVTADASLWDKINSHNYDVFAVNAAELQRYLAANLVQPLQPDAIPNTHKQLARFRDLAAIPGLMRNGNAYAIPFTYAQMGLIYDRKQFSSPPRSIDARRRSGFGSCWGPTTVSASSSSRRACCSSSRSSPTRSATRST